MKICAATGNPGKLKELRRILEKQGHQVLSQNELGLDLDPDEKMGNLTVAKMQMVEIAKAISYDSRIVIMDEPTSSLTDAEVEHLFRIIAELKAKNVAIIYISHKMDEIFRISDALEEKEREEFVRLKVVKSRNERLKGEQNAQTE